MSTQIETPTKTCGPFSQRLIRIGAAQKAAISAHLEASSDKTAPMQPTDRERLISLTRSAQICAKVALSKELKRAGFEICPETFANLKAEVEAAARHQAEV
jgi:hypothetical protein